MGILNVTPDSFSDGGLFSSLDAARRHADAMADDGADMIDVGGESTRPGASEVGVAEELDRVIPVIEAVTASTGLPVSVDTSKAAVMREAVAAGATLINDVRALREPGALEAAAELRVPVCLMHMHGEPRTMQQAPQYADVTADVATFLRHRARECVAAGICGEDVFLDPGFGFGKSHCHNVELLANLGQLRGLGYPLIVGLSRKSTIGELTGRPLEQRIAGSVAAAVIAVMNGADVVRVHDIRDTKDALQVAAAVLGHDE